VSNVCLICSPLLIVMYFFSFLCVSTILVNKDDQKPISIALTHLRDLPLVVENRRTTAERRRRTNFDILQLFVVSATTH